MPLGEFELITRYFDNQRLTRTDVSVGIGDDGAIVTIPPDHQLVVTMDTLVSGIHFAMDCPPADIGYKALAVNLSDLAAMGAEPAWATLGLTLSEADPAWLAGFTEGFFSLAETCEVQLIGGDITRGPLTITIQAHGFVPTGTALLRRGAAPGDAIYVSGTLGDAALALNPPVDGLTAPDLDYIRLRLQRPTPRLALGQCLRGIASSAIDISDGLLADLGHILSESKVGATIALNAIPLSPTLAKLNDSDERRQLILAGGDDYELCFTVPVGKMAALATLKQQLVCPLTRIGQIEAEQGLRCRTTDGSFYHHSPHYGYQHF